MPSLTSQIFSCPFLFLSFLFPTYSQITFQLLTSKQILLSNLMIYWYQLWYIMLFNEITVIAITILSYSIMLSNKPNLSGEQCLIFNFMSMHLLGDGLHSLGLALGGSACPAVLHQ